MTPEFSRPVLVDQLPARTSHHRIEADAAERAAIAERLDVPAILSLEAEIELKPLSRSGLIAVNGRLTARLSQTCVVTLQPLETEVTEAFRLTYAPPESSLDGEAEIELSLEDEDPPDPIENGAIDLGEVTVEHLALAIDPFPRSPGVVFQPPSQQEEDTPDDKPNPFAVLAAFKARRGLKS